MAKKASPPVRIAPLQRVVAEPITDPAERAALDEACKRPQEDAPVVRVRGIGRKNSASSRVLELCRRLPELERSALLMRLATRTPEAQLECLAHLLAVLPPDLLRQLEEDLRPRLAQ